MFGDNSYIYNTYSAAGEKLTTQYAVQALPVLSPLSGNGGTMETHPAAGTEDVTGGLWSGPATPIDTDHRYYYGNMVYDRGERRLLTDEGYVTFAADGTPQYHFYLRDHLGNIRVVFDQTGAVEQVTHYYPFGGLMRESTNPGLQPYKYGGKELDRTSGLDAYDFGARMFFADRLQWGQMDPLCEKYYDVSPYGYCHNNPLNRTDFNGMDDLFNEKGDLIWTTEHGNNVYIVKNQVFVKPSSLDYKSYGNLKMLEKIASYYIGKSDNQTFKVIAEEVQGIDPDGATMAYLESNDTYYVELHEGHLSQWYDQQYDIESVAFHESRHRYDESTREPVIGEIIAVLQQMKHPNWKYTSSEFKVGQLNYALNELNKLKKDEETIMKLKNLLINSLGTQFNQSDNTIESNLNDIIVTPNK